MTVAARPTLVAAAGIRKSFGSVQALKGVSFDVAAGDVHALVGENGAGKSTLIKILSGAEVADAGSLVIAGHPLPLDRMTPAVSRERGISVIYQQPALFPDLTVAENIALAVERGPAWRAVDWKARHRRASDWMARIGASIDPDRLAGSLSLPEQQLVELAKAVGADARVVLMDEPTASLTDHEVRYLFDVIGTLRRRGLGVIYISHRLDEVFAVASRLTVLRDGATVASGAIGDFSHQSLVRHMAGRDAPAVVPAASTPERPVALEVRNLSSTSAGVHDVTLDVRAGEILGLAGLVGSGRTELAETLFGLHPIDDGEVVLGGVPARMTSPADAARLGLAYVPEDRRRHGVVADMSVAANVTMAVLPAVSRNGILLRRREEQLATTFIDRLRVKTPSSAAHVSTLSGGNQQKVAVARALATSPQVLILDEPTQGVDVAAKAEIHRAMRELADQGKALVMISSDLAEVIGVSDRVAVMRAGTIRGVFTRADATAERVLALALQDDLDAPRSQEQAP